MEELDTKKVEDQTDQTTNPSTSTDGDNTKETNDNQTSEELKQFTQAQIDEMIIKAKKQATKKYADYDELKTKAETFEQQAKEKELAEMDELNRTKTLLEEKDAEYKRLQEQIDSMTKQQKQNELTAAFEKEAASASIPSKYLNDAKLLAGINEDTNAEEMAEIVKKLVEEKPFLVEKKEPQQKQIGDATNNAESKVQDKSKEDMLQEAANKARKTGRIEDKIAYVNLKRELGI